MAIHADTISYLPTMVKTEGGLAPESPSDVSATGIDRSILLDLALKTAHAVPNITTEAAAQRMLLPRVMVSDLLEQLRREFMLEVLGQSESSFGYRYTVSQRGRERVARSLEISGYVGPTPVSLEAYQTMLQAQIRQRAHVTPEQVRGAIDDLVLSEEVAQIAGLAASSGRSLFLSGPAGNGKTTLGRRLHNVRSETLWIPYCIAVDNSIIRLYDPHCHEEVPHALGKVQNYDQRWIKIKRPFVVAGGEMTLASLDLMYSPSMRYYEAPLHVKANGGTFLIDDFGRQHVEPEELLNRWIIPMEQQIDFLTLHTGQKIEVPFQLMLIIATNLDPKDVTDPAFLRRLGYRAKLEGPTPERYAAILTHYAQKCGVEVSPRLVTHLLDRYRKTGREMRSCEPRDLIERARDICTHLDRKLELTEDTLALAWKGYFGEDLV